MQQLDYDNGNQAFSMWSVPKCYMQGTKLVDSSTRVEAGSNTSTVTLRVVGGDEKEVSNLRE
jgi:hypothetical protein